MIVFPMTLPGLRYCEYSAIIEHVYSSVGVLIVVFDAPLPDHNAWR
jgi:hypothetical protein